MKFTKKIKWIMPAMVFFLSFIAWLTLANCLDAGADADAGSRFFGFDSATGTITGYFGSEKSVIIPESIDGRPVTTIGLFAFSYKQLTSVDTKVSETFFHKGSRI